MAAEAIGIKEQDLAYLNRQVVARPVLDQRGEKVITRQSEADAVDVNQLMKRLERTGELPPPGAAVYADVSEFGDFRSVQDQVNLANAQFMQLPAEIRRRFDNDTATFLDFVSTADKAALEAAGLVQKAPEAPGAAATPPAVP